MARTTVIADDATSTAGAGIHPLNAGTDKVYVVCTFDTPDGGVRQTAIPLHRFNVENGPNKGRSRWAVKGGKYGTVVDSRFELPTTGFVATFTGKDWVQHSPIFVFERSDAMEREDGSLQSARASAPTGDSECHVTVRAADGSEETLRLVNWVAEARSGRQTGIRSRLALLGLSGTAKRDSEAKAVKAPKTHRNVGGVEIL